MLHDGFAAPETHWPVGSIVVSSAVDSRIAMKRSLNCVQTYSGYSAEKKAKLYVNAFAFCGTWIVKSISVMSFAGGAEPPAPPHFGAAHSGCVPIWLKSVPGC